MKSPTKPSRSPAAAPAAMPTQCGPIVLRPVDELVPYAGNPRKHPEKQLAKLMASIRTYGFTVPVLTTSAGEIVAGHARLEAARRLGLPSLPTLCLDHLTPAQIRQYRLADNQLGAGSSWDLALLSAELRAIVEIDEIGCVETMGWDIPEVEILFDAAPVMSSDRIARPTVNCRWRPPPSRPWETSGSSVAIACCVAPRSSTPAGRA